MELQKPAFIILNVTKRMNCAQAACQQNKIYLIRINVSLSNFY